MLELGGDAPPKDDSHRRELAERTTSAPMAPLFHRLQTEGSPCPGTEDSEITMTSETKRQEARLTGRIAVHQSAKADLMGDAGASQTFRDDSDHETQHGGPAVEQLNPLELIPMDLFFCPVAEPGFVR